MLLIEGHSYAPIPDTSVTRIPLGVLAQVEGCPSFDSEAALTVPLWGEKEKCIFPLKVNALFFFITHIILFQLKIK